MYLPTPPATATIKSTTATQVSVSSGASVGDHRAVPAVAIDLTPIFVDHGTDGDDDKYDDDHQDGYQLVQPPWSGTPLV